MLPTLHSLARLQLSAEQASQLAAELSDCDDWAVLLQECELAGITPLLRQHIDQHEWVIPADIKLGLKALVMRHRAAAAARYEVMQAVLPAFAEAEIPLVALKGVALAPMLYPVDELRPMRDIDLLVPKECEARAAEILRELGFDLPQAQASRFMRDSHQLPNATKTVNGFTISIEIHHDALSRDIADRLDFQQVKGQLHPIRWRELTLTTLGHEHMLYQVARHLAGLHPGAVLKVINILDVVLYAEKYQEELDWARLANEYPHVLNTLRCLHYVVPLSKALQQRIGGVDEQAPAGVGETMWPLTKIAAADVSLRQKWHHLMSPPDWWCHLYYNVDPRQTLRWVKLIRHPLTVARWLGVRAWSALLGG